MKVTSFSFGDTLFASTRIFYGLKELPNAFTQSTFFKKLVSATVYIDVALIMSNWKSHKFQVIQKLHETSTQNTLN